MKLFDLSGRVAIVTGGNGGIGLGMAKGMALAGATVVVAGRNAEKNDAAVAELKALGAAASAIAVDVLQEASCRALISNTVKAHGRLDILVNNAGINAWEPLSQATTATWDKVMATNVSATYLLAREAARLMVPRGYGRIVNVGSALAVKGRENIAAYVSSKHGLAGMTRALAAELGPHGITCNMLAPGYFVTEINTTILARPGYEQGVSRRIPLRRWGQPEEIGGVAAFMVSRASSYMNGHVLMVDGGLTETLVLPVDTVGDRR